MSDNHNLSPQIHLPPEFWENVILELDAPVALKLRALNRAFCRLIDGSPRIQCGIEMFAVGLKSGPRTNLFSPADQRTALERYCTRWERLEHAERVSVNADKRRTKILEPLIIYQVATGGKRDHHFLQVPSPSKGLSQKEWAIRDFPGNFFRCAAVQPAHDLVVMVEYHPGLLYKYEIHCLQLSTGQPHPRAWGSPFKTFGSTLEIKVSGHRLAALRNHGGRHDGCLWNQTLIIWDWETGEILHNMKVYFSLTFYFVDDYRLAILRKSGFSTRDNSLVIYDTSGEHNPTREVPQLVLRLPDSALAVGFHGPGEIPDSEDAFFTPNREQSLLAIKIKIPDPGLVTPFFLVVAFEGLFALATGDPERTMEFDEWEHAAHKAKIPPSSEWGSIAIGVCGPTILVLQPDVLPAQYSLWVCDFSPYARRTNLASGRQQRYTLRQHKFQAQEALEGDNRWTISSGGLVLYQTWPDGDKGVYHVIAL